MYKRITQVKPSMNTKIYIKDYYSSHCVRPATTNKKSKSRNPLTNRSHSSDKLMYYNIIFRKKSNNILLYNGIEYISNQAVNLKFWEICKFMEYGYRGTKAVKVSSVSNKHETGLIITMPQFIYMSKNNELMTELANKLVVIDEHDTYSSLHEALDFPHTDVVVLELLRFLIQYIHINKKGAIKLNKEGKELINEADKAISNKEEKEYEDDLDYHAEIFVNQILSSIVSEENIRINGEYKINNDRPPEGFKLPIYSKEKESSISPTKSTKVKPHKKKNNMLSSELYSPFSTMKEENNDSIFYYVFDENRLFSELINVENNIEIKELDNIIQSEEYNVYKIDNNPLTSELININNDYQYINIEDEIIESCFED